MLLDSLIWVAGGAEKLQGQVLAGKLEEVKGAVKRSLALVEETTASVKQLVWSGSIALLKVWLVLGTLFFLLCSCAVGSGLAAGATSLGTYYLFVPQDTTTVVPFSFDYNTTHPNAVLSVGGYDQRLTAIKHAFHDSATYNFTVNLNIPETDHNMRLSTFTIAVVVRGDNGDELSRLTHSAVLQSPRSELLRHVSDLLLLPVYVTTSTLSAPMQQVSLPMKVVWRPLPHENITDIKVLLSPSVHVHSSELVITAHLHGIAGFLQRWPVTSCIMTFGLTFLVCFNVSFFVSVGVLLTGFYWFSGYLQSVQETGWSQGQTYNKPPDVHYSTWEREKVKQPPPEEPPVFYQPPALPPLRQRPRPDGPATPMYTPPSSPLPWDDPR